jgi:16S rRNA (guanine527-N7)-methyltransferase
MLRRRRGRVRLTHTEEYEARGVSGDGIARLAKLGDLILQAGFNVTGLDKPEDIERQHFLDSLSLLQITQVNAARSLVDIGSGGGLPALLLALALPDCRVTALESQRKKCIFIENTALQLALTNVAVTCMRAEEYGRSEGRAAHDMAVSRAVASLPVIAEYSLPMLRLGGTMLAMKGLISDQERIQASKALGILGADELEMFRLEPFEGSVNRCAYLAQKVRPTPDDYPRRIGMPAKRPLG